MSWVRIQVNPQFWSRNFKKRPSLVWKIQVTLAPSFWLVPLNSRKKRRKKAVKPEKRSGTGKKRNGNRKESNVLEIWLDYHMNRRKLVAFSLTTITDYCRLTLLTPRAFHLHNMKSSAAQESFSTKAKQKKTFFRAFTPPASVVMYAPLHFSLPQRYTYTLFSLGAIILATH